MPKKLVSPTSSGRRHRRTAGDALNTHRHWLAHAETVANQPVSRGGSPHPTVKVGAVLVDARGKIIASAANRFAHGVDRRRPERFREGWKSLWINCAEQFVIAEALRKRASIKNAKLYVTLEPCAICSGMIGELRLKKIYVPVGAMRRYSKLKAKWKTSIEIGLTKLAESGVELIAIDTKRS